MAIKPYLCEPKPGYVYVRKGGKYLGRITAPRGTLEFDRQYWEILRGKRSPSATSWNALIESYRLSDRWNGLKPRTRADYDRVMTYIAESNGSRDATRAIRADVIAAMDANRHRVRFANYIPQVMSILVEHGIDIGWPFRSNPAKGVRLLKTPAGRRQPHIPLTDAGVSTWRSLSHPLPRLIFEIGVGTVQRPADWTRFEWGHYNGDELTIVQGKTGRPLRLPCTAHLKAALDRRKAELPAAPLPSVPILAKRDGSRMTYRHIARLMLAERKRLGLEAHDLHALRYRGVMELAWAGCTDDEIAAYSGHASKEMIVKYAGEARQIMRARQARGKRQ